MLHTQDALESIHPLLRGFRVRGGIGTHPAGNGRGGTEASNGAGHGGLHLGVGVEVNL
jgi:hypothetical protein